MKQYEAYKDSGIEWWGNVPAHWDLLRAKHMFSLVTENVSDSTLPKIALENIESGTGRYIETESDFMGKGIEFEKDDILFGKLRPYLAKVYQAEFNGQSVGDIYVFRSKVNQEPNFLKYLLLSYPFISAVDGSTYGAKMPRANWEFISHMFLPCPPITEQQIIASYLDHKVGQIDAVITEKGKILEDLKAYRIAIISEAVTKGLDKNVEMKNSGIEWLGAIPAHWECSSLKYHLSQPLQYGANESAESNNSDWPRYIRITDIDEYGNLKNETFKSLAPEKAKDYLLEKDDVLFARSGATIGKTYIFKENYKACFAGYLIKAKCGTQLLPKFLYLYTNTSQYENWKNSVFIQATIQNIGADKYSLLPIVIPPIEEQQNIIEYINTQLNTIGDVITEIRSQIDDLKAYRSSIITETVTGKVDLRDWKPNNDKRYRRKHICQDL